MEKTLIILKPSTVQRGLVGEVIDRFQKKGLIIAGMKMMQLDEAILREHYAHLVDRPFFPSLLRSMMATPVIVMCLKGKDVVAVGNTDRDGIGIALENRGIVFPGMIVYISCRNKHNRNCRKQQSDRYL